MKYVAKDIDGDVFEARNGSRGDTLVIEPDTGLLILDIPGVTELRDRLSEWLKEMGY